MSRLWEDTYHTPRWQPAAALRERRRPGMVPPQRMAATMNATAYPLFYRLAAGLRAAVMDFDYYRTRKLLDPNWDGYDMPPGHDFVHTDIDLDSANLLTSQHRDNPTLHRIVLDLDYGIARQPALIESPDRLTLARDPGRAPPPTQLRRTVERFLRDVGVPAYFRGFGLQIEPECDYALIPSTTDGHYHLILDVNMEWPKYRTLLHMLANSHIIEPGYAKASIRREFSAIRPPWIRKPTRQPAETRPG